MNSGYAATGTIVTKDFTAPDPFSEIVIHGVDIIARSASATANITVQFRKDQVVDSGITLTFPVSGYLTAYNKLYPNFIMGTENYIKGNSIGLSIALPGSSKHAAIKAIHIWGEICPLPESLEV